MLIDRIYKKVQTFVNTELRGNVSPSEFNLFLHDAIQNRNEEYFYDISRMVNKENRGYMPNSLENLADRYREKVAHYLVEDVTLVLVTNTTNKYTLPADYRYIDEISINGNTSFEMTKDNKEFNIVKALATKQFPVMVQVANTIKVSPATLEAATISYLRKVKIPRWTFAVVNGAELFNPSANDFVDADIHPSEEDEIVSRVLMRFGVNLKEQDIQAYTMNKDNIDFNQENQV
jgi:hypothetical protein